VAHRKNRADPRGGRGLKLLLADDKGEGKAFFAKRNGLAWGSGVVRNELPQCDAA